MLVAVSHSGFPQDSLWLGVIAVVIFFILSGFAMTGLIETRFMGPGGAKSFFVERFVRLAPQYYFWLAVALMVSLLTPWMPLTIRGHVAYDLFSYFAVFLLGLQFYIQLSETHVIPQANSLGLEVCFYALSPWILPRRSFVWAAFIVGYLVFLATAAGLLTRNVYTYFAFPGPIVFYFLGNFIYRRDRHSLALACALLAAALAVHLYQHFDLEMLLGVFLGCPVLWLLSRTRSGAIDAALGNASYGCFLCHVTISAVVKGVAGRSDFNPALAVASIVLSVLAGYMTYYVLERPLVPWRRALGRGRTA